MWCFKRNSIWIVFLLCAWTICAQQFPSKNLSTLDGLPSNTIRALFIDSRGITWAGTQNRLAMVINGEIKNFSVKDGLSHNSIWAIAEDQKHNMWFGSYGGGITKFDGQQFSIFNTGNGLVNDQVRKLFSYKNKIYVGTTHGISVIDIDSNQVENYVGKVLQDRFQVMGFFEDRGEIYILTYVDGLWKISDNELHLVRMFDDENGRISLFKDKNTLYVDDKNPFVGKAIQRISIEDYIGGKSEKHFGGTHFWDYAKDKRGQIFGAGDGVDFNTGGIFIIGEDNVENLSKQYNVNSNDVWSVCYDKRNDFLYVGTLDKGIFQVDLSGTINFTTNIATDRKVLGIEKLKDKTLLLYDNELKILKGKEVESITSKMFIDFSKRYLLNHKPGYGVGEKFGNKITLGLRSMKLYKNKLYISTSQGMFVFNDDLSFEKYIVWATNNVFGFTQSGEILSPRGYSGVDVFEDTENFNGKFTDIAPNTPVDVIEILPANEKSYLVSRSNGLYTYFDGDFNSYRKSKIWDEKDLIAATLDSKEQLIIANASGDIFVLNDKNDFKIIKKIGGGKLIGNTITVLESYKGYIIIGTEKGLNIWQNGKLKFLDEEQGLIHKIFTSSKVVGDELLLGTSNGFYTIKLGKLLEQKQLPTKLVVSQILVNYEPYNSDYFKWFCHNQEKITLPYDHNTLSIKFSPINHPYPNKLTYRYKLVGVPNSKYSDWIQNRTINLPFLPGGDFILRLEVKDNNSGEAKTTDLLKFEILPPFWNTWWFAVLVTIFTIGTGYFIYKKRIAAIKTKEQEKSNLQKRLSETRLEALQSQMNPHFIFNAMNSIQNYVIDENTDKALQYIGEFSKLVRQTLDNSAKLKITLEEELDYLRSYIALENMRLGQRVMLNLSVEPTIDTFEIEVPPMLVQPFVENVFVHAFDGLHNNPKLDILFTKDNNCLVIIIIDNGKGMDSAHNLMLSKSKGMILAKERISLLQGDSKILIKSEIGTGTVIKFRLEIC